MVHVEFNYEYEFLNNKITLEVYNSRRGPPEILDNNNVNIAIYVEASHPKLYNYIYDELCEREEEAEQERREEGGHIDEDAWKGYD